MHVLPSPASLSSGSRQPWVCVFGTTSDPGIPERRTLRIPLRGPLWLPHARVASPEGRHSFTVRLWPVLCPCKDPARETLPSPSKKRCPEVAGNPLECAGPLSKCFLQGHYPYEQFELP